MDLLSWQNHVDKHQFAIFIRDLTAETTIGIFNWERDIRQKVVIDLEMEVDGSNFNEIWMDLASKCNIS